MLVTMPQEWKEYTLKELADPSDKFSFKGGPFGSDLKSSHYTEIGVRVLQLQDIGEGNFLDKSDIYTSDETADELLACNIFPGDILLAKMSPVARCCIVPEQDERYVMCSDGIRLSVDKERFDRDYVFYALNDLTFRRKAEALSTGTTRARIGLSDLKALSIFCPSKFEQQKIAEVLLTVDQKIDLIDQKIAETQKLKTGLMQKLFSEGVGVQDEEGNWQPHTELDSNRIPFSWQKGEVLDFLQLQRGHDLPVKQRVGGDVPIIGSNGVAGYHSEAISESCGVITGRSGTLGKLYFSEGSYWPLNTSLYIKDFKGNCEKYCFYFLQQFKLERFGTGTGVPTLNRNIVHKQPVAFPPLAEQIQVTVILDTVSDQLRLLEKQKLETQQLKKGLMQKLLTGEWRVPLDNQQVV